MEGHWAATPPALDAPCPLGEGRTAEVARPRDTVDAWRAPPERATALHDESGPEHV